MSPHRKPQKAGLGCGRPVNPVLVYLSLLTDSDADSDEIASDSDGSEAPAKEFASTNKRLFKLKVPSIRAIIVVFIFFRAREAMTASLTPIQVLIAKLSCPLSVKLASLGKRRHKKPKRLMKKCRFIV